MGPYEIRTPIGIGGMGEVYRDDRVGRGVAIKVSAERFSDRLERHAGREALPGQRGRASRVGRAVAGDRGGVQLGRRVEQMSWREILFA